MAINRYNIKKWYKMLTGKSILHVNQDLGKEFVPGKIQGYFNNMTEKVIKEPNILHSNGMPLVKSENGNTIEFPVAIFQYGLGSYDLYLSTQEKNYHKKFMQCVDWAMSHQDVNGAWNNFFFCYPEHPFGAMCQGEGASLLVRAFISTHNDKYYRSAKKAIDYMLLPVADGGTTDYIDNMPCFLEYTHLPAVLNGWIFALFGLYDFSIICNDCFYRDMYKKAISVLKKKLPQFVGKYWSMYDLDGKIASPFYHNLHIAQLEALYMVTNDDQIGEICMKWKKQQKNVFCKSVSFMKKSFQKILE